MKHTSHLTTVTKRPKSRLLVPGACALALSWSAVFAHAQSGAPNTVNAVLGQFSSNEGLSGTKALTVVTASDADLARAVYDAILNGDSPTSAVTEALSALNGKARADINTVAPRIFNAAIAAVAESNATANVPLSDVTFTNILTATLNANSTSGNTKLELTAAGKEAVAAEALQESFTGPGIQPSTFPTTIGKDVYNALVSQGLVGGSVADAAQNSAIAGTLKTVTSAASLQSVQDFVSNAFGGKSSSSANADAQAIALLDAKNPVAVEGAVAAAASIDGTAGSIESFITATIANPKLASAVAAVVAGGERALPSGSAVSYATSISGSAKSTLLPAIASGVLQGAGLPSGTSTTDVLNAIFKTLPANLSTAAGQVATGTGATDGLGNSRAAEVAAYFLSKQTATGAKGAAADAAIGEAVLKAIGTANPSAADTVAANVVNAYKTATGTDATTAAEALASLLPKSVTNAAAAGAAAEGLATGLSSSAQLIVAENAIKTASKSAVNIAQDVALAVGSSAAAGTASSAEESFGKTLASGVTSANAGSAIAGVAAALGAAKLPTATATAAYYSADLVQSILSANPTLQGAAVTIATKVASAVDIDQIDNIATAVASLLNSSKGTKLPLAAASKLASGLAKAIELNPTSSFAKKTTELSELAASIVSQIVGKSSTTAGTEATNAAAEEKLIASVGAAILKTIGPKLYANAIKVGGVPSDLQDAAQYITGSIAQAIAVATTSTTGFTTNVLKDLLTSNSSTITVDGKKLPTLESALAAAAGKTYASLVGTAFSEVSGAYTSQTSHIYTAPQNSTTETNVPIGTNGVATTTGVYQIGSVVNPETPTKNI